MKRKEINIFGTSFLDLLSGALAAVIILFIIVPKMSSEQQEALEEIERMNVQVEELSSLMEQLENSVPQDVYREIEQRLEQLQETISDLTSEVSNLQETLARVQSENEELTNELNRLSNVESELAQMRIENRQLQERIQELQDQQPQQDGQGISDGKVFGIDAKVGVVCFWRENVDVDLHVRNLATGQICNYSNKTTSFGNLNEDIQSRSDPDDDRFELFYQRDIVPGRYEISLVYYKGSSYANVEGYIVMNPGKRNQIKIPYRDLRMSQNGRIPIKIGILTISENAIDFQEY